LQNGTEMYTPSESVDTKRTSPQFFHAKDFPIGRVGVTSNRKVNPMRSQSNSTHMRTAVTALAVALWALPLSAQTNAQKTPVLVELFTSEGCSSCPPADALLARLLKQQPVAAADIIVLEEHVDYWDSLGWRDRFSSHQFTERQTAYSDGFRLDSPYTPQMVVDGAEQFTGNDSARALRAIAQAAHAPKLPLTLSPLKIDSDRVSASVVIPATATLPKADLYATLIETVASTQVLRGENGGRTLQHVSVVRAMQRIGTPDKAANGLPFTLAVPKDAVTQNLRVVVFAQRPGQGMVVGAASSSAIAPANQAAQR